MCFFKEVIKTAGNQNNLKHKLTVEEQRKGGKKSGQVRKEKKLLKNIVDEFLETDIKNMENVRKLAKKIGINEEDNIKKLFAVVCILNTLKKGDVSDIITLAEFLGETDKNKNADVIDKLDSVLNEIKGNI